MSAGKYTAVFPAKDQRHDGGEKPTITLIQTESKLVVAETPLINSDLLLELLEDANRGAQVAPAQEG